ncbi:MAG: hypothetical protein C4516_04215 [Oxalobacter sp.]|nr:MAG: hypothetical protein C4516_04215 [Oxalobacter sp.]
MSNKTIPHCGTCANWRRNPEPHADTNTLKMAEMGWHNCALLEKWRFFHDQSVCAKRDMYREMER